jgi:hypothetical protein
MSTNFQHKLAHTISEDITWDNIIEWVNQLYQSKKVERFQALH